MTDAVNLTPPGSENIAEMEKPAEWFAELEANKNYYKNRALEAEKRIKSLRDALENVLLAYEDESLNGPEAEDAMARAARDGLAT